MSKPNLFLAILLSVVVLLVWNKFFAPPTPPISTQQVGSISSETSSTGLPKEALVESNTNPVIETQSSKQFWDFTLGNFQLQLSNELGSVGFIKVAVEAISKEVPSQVLDFSKDFNLKEFNRIIIGNEKMIGTWSQDNDSIVFLGKNSLAEIRQTIRLNSRYELNFTNEISFLSSNKPKFVFVSNSFEASPEASSGGIFSSPYGGRIEKAYFYSAGDLETLSKEGDFIDGFEGTSELSWSGLGTNYFVFLNNFAPKDKSGELFVARATSDLGIRYIQAGIRSTDSNTLKFSFSSYLGPKLIGPLKAANASYSETLEFGILGPISFLLLKIMNYFYSFFGNYGVAIILLTLVVKISTFPFAYKGIKGMKEMSKIQPLLKEIREKHKEDPAKMNQETMRVMKDNKVNPFGSCLLSLIQIPIFFALFQVLRGPVELYGAPFAGWIMNLTEKDPYFILPVGMGIMWFFQQKMTPQTTMDPTQQKVLQFMPIIFTVFMLTMPAGLSLYMFTNAFLSIVQQWYFNKKFV